MKVKQSYANIKKLLEMYRESADLIAQRYTDRKQKIQGEYLRAKESGKYNEGYLSEILKKEPESADLMQKLEGIRAKAQEGCKAELNKMSELLVKYFEAPIPSEFSNTIQALRIVGDTPTMTEIELMRKGANGCYMAEKLLQSFANSLTVTENKVIMNDQGEAEYKEVQTKAPVLFKIPNIDSCYKSLSTLENTVNNFLNRYPGANSELLDLICTDTQNEVEKAIFVATGDSFFKQATQNQIESKLEELVEIENRVPEEEYTPKKDFTEADKRFIDSIVDPRYPTVARGTIKNIAEYGEANLISLVLADSRYSDIMREELKI